MPAIVKTPANLRPYLFHGLDLSYEDGEKEAQGECPWCGRAGKFSVSVETGEWQCFVCRAGTERGGGNVYTFLRLLHEESDKRTNGTTKQLAEDRRLLYPETLTYWGVVQSVLTGEWLVPGYSADGKLTQLYRYVKVHDGKMKLLPTPELGHALFGRNLYDAARPAVYLCEGPWDGMALWETLRGTKRTDEGEYRLTGAEASSLLAGANVLAVPGCGSIGGPLERWAPLLADKTVHLMFDSDHPREHNGRIVEPAGYTASQRAANILSIGVEPPKELRWLKWGEAGFDPDLPSGFDVRDWLARGTSRHESAGTLISKLEPIPTEWVKGSKARGSAEVTMLECTDWATLRNSWRKAMRWTDGLDFALAVCLAAAASVRVVGDQVWLMIMSPPSTGKSELAEALALDREHVKAISAFRGFYSGYQTDAEGSENLSLVEKLRNKAFVVKDGDTLLTLPNKDQIMGQARDLYDTTGRTAYNNKMSRDYEGLRFAWLLFGTFSLRALDTSELGERFLKCRIMESISEELEDDIGWRKINLVRQHRFEVDGKLETTDTEEKIQAKRLTAGYLHWLRTNIGRLLPEIEMSDSVAKAIVSLGTFVAYMRARPSKRQDEEEGREMSPRLISQLGKLALCLAAATNHTAVNAEVLACIRRVAVDTASGRSLNIARCLYNAGDEGVETGGVAAKTHYPEDGERKLLRFMRRLGAVELYTRETKGVRVTPRWRLSKRMRRLYEEAVRG